MALYGYRIAVLHLLLRLLLKRRGHLAGHVHMGCRAVQSCGRR
jgi:hypothetical protein